MRAAITAAVLLLGAQPASTQPRTNAQWVDLARGGFVVPPGETAVELLVAMRPLLAVPDPVLRDEVAYAAAERWILRDRVLGSDDLRRVMRTWLDGLAVGLGTTGDDRIFERSFSALCLSLVAARDVATPFLTAGEAHDLRDRLFDYLARERDLRGFDAATGWKHAVAHTADALKFLARGAHWQAADLGRLLDGVDDVVDRAGTVFVWGEPERLAAALHAAVRRPDADAGVVAAWVERWVGRHQALWKGGPRVEPRAFASVENSKQVLRALAAFLAFEPAPTSAGEAARRATLAALARMR